MIFSNSRIQTYLNCPSAYYFRYIRNLVLSNKSVNLIYGEIIHSMFQSFFFTFNKTGSEEAAYNEAKQTLIEDYCNNNVEHETKTVEAGLKFLADVIEFELHKSRDIVKVSPELQLQKVLFTYKDTDIAYRGKLDLLILLANSDKRIYDFKTISRLGNSYYQTTWMGRQFISYCWLANTNSLELLPLHCIKKPNALAPYSMEYTEENKSVWELETKSIVNNILRKHDELDRDIRNINVIFPKSCTTCTGTFSCDYFRLCNQGVMFENTFVDNVVYGEREEQS